MAVTQVRTLEDATALGAQSRQHRKESLHARVDLIMAEHDFRAVGQSEFPAATFVQTRAGQDQAAAGQGALGLGIKIHNFNQRVVATFQLRQALEDFAARERRFGGL